MKVAKAPNGMVSDPRWPGRFHAPGFSETELQAIGMVVDNDGMREATRYELACLAAIKQAMSRP